MTLPTTATLARATYRHGDLYRALLDAGVSLAREGGPSAIVLREATRRAGVVPNAAYRHFACRADLLAAVRSYALSAAARSMASELEKLAPLPARSTKAQRAVRARDRLRAVGAGYLAFAMSEPGLFRTAFAVQNNEFVVAAATASEGGPVHLGPYGLLGAALDGLVVAGVLPRERREHAELVAWSAVHGLAMLILDGPLPAQGPEEIARLTQLVLDMVDRGI